MGLVESIEFGFTAGRYDALWDIVLESAFDYWNGQLRCFIFGTDYRRFQMVVCPFAFINEGDCGISKVSIE